MISAKLKERLGEASSICVLTGAGISAESGVPTFRGNDGLWKKFRPEELANVNAFLRNPDLVWEWYAYRRNLISAVRPNPGHTALVEMERLVRKFTLVTQNVDNLHRRAGSINVLELHGNIERSYCIACGKGADEASLNAAVNAPRCDSCGGLIRPGVVWFGEMLPQETFEAADEAARWCDLFLCVGTSAVVYPAASLPIAALNAGAYVVEINTERTELSGRVQETLLGPSGTILPQMAALLRTSRGMTS